MEDAGLITVVFLAIGGTAGYLSGRRTGRSDVRTAAAVYIARKRQEIDDLSNDQQTRLDGWLKSLEEYLNADYLWKSSGRGL